MGRTVEVARPGGRFEFLKGFGERFSEEEAAKDPDLVRQEYYGDEGGLRVRTVFYYRRIKRPKKPSGGPSGPTTPDEVPPVVVVPPPPITPGPIPDGHHPRPEDPPVVVAPPGGPGTPWPPISADNPPWDGIIRVAGNWYEIELDTGDVAKAGVGWTPGVTVKGGGAIVEVTWTAPPRKKKKKPKRAPSRRRRTRHEIEEDIRKLLENATWGTSADINEQLADLLDELAEATE